MSGGGARAIASFPAVFVSHGPPTIALEPSPAHHFLKRLGAELGRPEAILCLSAHWETERPAASTAAAPATIYDFHGFPEPLYRLGYPAPGAPELARRAQSALAGAGLECDLDPDRGLDHGAWMPLLLMYPEADVPVAQLSIQHHLGPAHHLALGRALQELRHEGVLVLASGNVTHNLGEALGRLGDGGASAGTATVWATAFDDWVAEMVSGGRADELVSYREHAPFGARAHPRDEHFLPLIAAAGAGGEGATGRRLHASFLLGSMSMAAYAFG